MLKRVLGSMVAVLVLIILVTGCSRPADTGSAKPGEKGDSCALLSGTGMGSGASPETAGADAVAAALKKLGSDSADVIIVYATCKGEDYEATKEQASLAFQGATKAAGENLVVGCMATAGILTSEGYGVSNSVGAVALKGQGSVKIKVDKVNEFLEGMEKAGETLAKKIAGDKDVAMILLTDSNISHNAPEVANFLKGVKNVVAKGVAIAGGNSMGFDDFHAPVFYKDALLEKGGIGIMLSGHLTVGIGIANNFEFVNEKPMKITKSDGKAIFTLDDKPVADVVEALTGVDKEGQKDIGAALKNIFAYKVEDRPFIRFQRALKEDDKGIYYDGFPNGMPEGDEVYVARYNQEKLIPSSAQSVKNALASMGGAKPALAMPFVCCGRAGVGQEQVGENTAIRETLGKDVPVMGFYACGEYYTPDWKTEEEKATYCQFSSIVLLIGN